MPSRVEGQAVCPNTCLFFYLIGQSHLLGGYQQATTICCTVLQTQGSGCNVSLTSTDLQAAVAARLVCAQHMEGTAAIHFTALSASNASTHRQVHITMMIHTTNSFDRS